MFNKSFYFFTQSPSYEMMYEKIKSFRTQKTDSMDNFFVERITDVTNDICQYVDAIDIKEASTSTKRQLCKLYEYHRSNRHIHPLTNWHAHRIRCMSAIASKLEDMAKVWECHASIYEYFLRSCSCPCHCSDNLMKHRGKNHDFVHRNSLNYLVYGSQALVNACIYLQPFTNADYMFLFDPILDFLQPFLDGTKKHVEFVTSEIPEDRTKEEYKKYWDPNYAKTFLRRINDLKNITQSTN